MKLLARLSPDDFVVEEVLRLQPGGTGSYAVYKATKRLLTTPELQTLVAHRLGLPPRALAFPALKDKRAVTTQHFSVQGRPPSEIKGEGFEAKLIGYMSRPLGPTDLLGNRFTIAMRQLDAKDAQALAKRLHEIESEGLPNYFDEQRFGSLTEKGTFIGKAILQGDAEGALKAYLAEPAQADPPAIREMKTFAGQHWPDWSAIFEQAPRSNHRSVLNFLKGHPTDFRKALNLITPRLLPLLLASYQSYLWNKIACLTLKHRLGAEVASSVHLPIARDELLLYRSARKETIERLRSTQIPLLYHRAVFHDPVVAKAVEVVLAVEGLPLDQFKARLLKRAYLPKSSRSLLVFPQQVQTQLDKTTDRNKANLRLSFFLPPGSYATLVLKVLAATAE